MLRGALVAGLTALCVGLPAGYVGARIAQEGAHATLATDDAGVAPSVGGAQGGAESSLGSTQRFAVAVEATSEDVEGTGSGIVLDDRGNILTNHHVVSEAGDGIVVTSPEGERTEAEILGASQAYDLAILHIDPTAFGDDIVPATLGDSDTVRVGQQVYAVGAPMGLDATVTAGIVSAVNRPMEVARSDDEAEGPTPHLDAIQVDAPINPGNSGGPLVNMQGEVIGVNSAILSGDGELGQGGSIGLGFAIPINQAKPIADELIAHGEVRYPVFGADVVATQAGVGVLLEHVEPDGPAAGAGLVEGDLVLGIAGTPVNQAAGFEVAVRAHRPDEVVAVEYRREGHDGATEVTLGGAVG